MSEAKKTSIGAAFALGLAAGGGGVGVVQQDAIDDARQETVEVRAVLDELGVDKPGVDGHIENWTRAIVTQAADPRLVTVYAEQVILLASDMQGDDIEVPLKDLVGEFFGRLRTDDPRWQEWLVVESQKIQDELNLGYTVGTVSPDTMVNVNDVATRMATIADEYLFHRDSGQTADDGEPM